MRVRLTVGKTKWLYQDWIACQSVITIMLLTFLMETRWGEDGTWFKEGQMSRCH
jgi:hypothetical protein